MTRRIHCYSKGNVERKLLWTPAKNKAGGEGWWNLRSKWQSLALQIGH